LQQIITIDSSIPAALDDHCAVRNGKRADVCYGSKADIGLAPAHADIARPRLDVRFVPQADSCTAVIDSHIQRRTLAT
jgi:hypothetical protein